MNNVLAFNSTINNTNRETTLLHDTCQPHIKYTSFTNLPTIIKHFINKHCETLLVVECNKYTVFTPIAFIRHNATIDDVDYSIELTLGELFNDEELVYTEIEKALQLLECTELEELNAYLTIN